MDATVIPPKPGIFDAMAVLDEDKTELDKVLELLLDSKNIAHNTELSRNEITAFSTLKTIGTKYDLSVLKEFLAENMVLRVSKGRQGRKEWVKLVSRFNLSEENEMDMAPKPGGFRRFFRR